MTESVLAPKVENIGVQDGKVNVSIGARFLELFSEHLYSSPNKAFEELVANSWDAGAGVVHIGVPQDLSEKSATIWVLDDGESMDLAGLQMLWAVATSEKRRRPTGNNRRQIGKFGVGKLATYILARELTYVCKASDGVIRAVAMDYGQFAENPDVLHLEEIPLSVRKIDEDELRDVLHAVPDSDKILELIESGIPDAEPPDAEPPDAEPPDDDSDEFGRNGDAPSVVKGTWTLALLSSLKPAGRQLQHGRISWILRSALPLGSSISMVFNDEPLRSSKLRIKVAEEWTLGDNLGIEFVEVDESSYKVYAHASPEPHVIIEGIEGKITGKVRLYEDKISGGKSDSVGSSNGFFVNVLGRVVNTGDPDFGLKNLSHAAWAKFRATVRADGLDKYIGVNREDLQETPEVRAFQAYLRALFNKARTSHDAAERASWPDAGAVLQDKWHSVPLEPLRQVITEGLGSTVGLPDFVDASNVEDTEGALVEWENTARDQPGNLINDVEFETSSREEHLVKFDLAKRSVLINTQHPFFAEYGDTLERKLLLRDTALVDLLTNAYMVNIGLDWEQLRKVREYRDQVFRLMARVSRRSGAQIAELLVDAENKWQSLEIVVSEALYYLGFDVKQIGGNDDADGVATAPLTPKPKPDAGEDEVRTYKFTYDTKFSRSKLGKVQTGNIHISGLTRHRRKHGADHVLVVAPEYQAGTKLLEECEENRITPMRAADLAKLLMLTAATGPLDLENFRDVFDLTDPDDVGGWVTKKVEEVTSASASISYDLLLRALEHVGYSAPDAVHITLIADRIRQLSEEEAYVNKVDVRNIVAGLSVLVPNLMQLTSDGYVFLSSPPRRLREEIRRQISVLPGEYRFDLDSVVE